MTARPSWVLRGVVNGYSEEAKSRSFASLTFARFAFTEVLIVLSMRILSIPEITQRCPLMRRQRRCTSVRVSGFAKVGNWSLAVPVTNSSQTTASEGKAATRRLEVGNSTLNVCSRQDRSFKLQENHENEGQQTADSVEKLVVETAVIVAILSMRAS